MTTYATVPRMWAGETAVILATGPSLSLADVNACRGKAKVLAIKDALTLTPWADALYFCGSDAGRWWQKHTAMVQAFTGFKYTLDPRAAAISDVLRTGHVIGLSRDPSMLCTGKNSGFQALNLAVLLGATTILLLGYDMQPGPDGREYFFGEHPYSRPTPPFRDFREAFETLVEPLRQLGVRVVNCSRQTALQCFERLSLQEALA